jgi:GNAT superfamily N-acetyltransferase
MRLALRPATEGEREFCEALARRNLSPYLAARDTPWDSGLYLASWSEFENLMILANDQVAGVLRLNADGAALEIRDLQVVPAYQNHGIGSWAIQQARLLAAARGFGLVRLRVFEENPAKALYSQLGFVSETIVGGKVQMSLALPPNNPCKPKPFRASA